VGRVCFDRGTRRYYVDSDYFQRTARYPVHGRGGKQLTKTYMQNELDNSKVIYNEYLDVSRFIIREMIGTKNPNMAFQAGHYVNVPMLLPAYNSAGALTHHVTGDNIQKFHIHGNGKTKGIALERACNKLILEDIKAL
jgi:hypothetical protein